MAAHFTLKNLFLLILILVGSILLWHHVAIQYQANHLITATPPSLEMFTVNGMQMNKTGHPQYTLQSPRVLQLADGSKTRFDYPVIFLNNAATETWQVQADSALATHDFRQLDLRGHVRFNETTVNAVPQSLETEHLSLFPERRYASSLETVTMTQGENRLTGKGLEADFARGVIAIKSQVDVVYVFSKNIFELD